MEKSSIMGTKSGAIHTTTGLCWPALANTYVRSSKFRAVGGTISMYAWLTAVFTLAFLGFIDGVVFTSLIACSGILLLGSAVHRLVPYATRALLILLVLGSWWLRASPSSGSRNGFAQSGAYPHFDRLLLQPTPLRDSSGAGSSHRRVFFYGGLGFFWLAYPAAANDRTRAGGVRRHRRAGSSGRFGTDASVHGEPIQRLCARG